MKTYTITGLLAGLMCLNVSTASGRTLNATETEALVRTLTQTPRQYWISSGTLTVQHLEYRRSDDYLAQSTETVSVNGEQFRWDISLAPEDMGQESSSATESRQPTKSQDDVVNQKRLFCWNGEHYTSYYPNGSYAVISGSDSLIPFSPPKPLLAAIVPWGHGDFGTNELLQRNPIATEISYQGEICIQLSFLNKNITPALTNTLILNPEKDYAVLSFVMENEAARIENTYSDYTQYDTQWVPHIIRTERQQKTAGSAEMISYEDWKFVKIDTAIPSASSLQVKIKNGTLVEVHPSDREKSVLYHANDQTNITAILKERQTLTTGTIATQNCATAAARHLTNRFSQTISNDKKAVLAMEESGQTTLFALKQNLEEAGLYCMAVQTDIESLQALTDDCAAIVHLPGFQHYLILDRIEKDTVWTIDLTSRRVYWKQPLDDFVQDWREGTALLVASEPTKLPTNMKTLDSVQLYAIRGGQYGTYSCSELIQEADQWTCPDPIGGFVCGGGFYIFFERRGCQEDTEGGTCTGTDMDGYMVFNCINDPDLPGNCLTTNSRIIPIRACQ